MALLKLLQIRCICRIYCLFNCPQVNPPEAKFSCSFQELNLSLLEFVVDVKREHGLCLPLRYGAERSEAEGGCEQTEGLRKQMQLQEEKRASPRGEVASRSDDGEGYIIHMLLVNF